MKQNLQQIDLNLSLLVFDTLMQERNPSRAAARLHKSQPAVATASAACASSWGSCCSAARQGAGADRRGRTLQRSVRQALALLQSGIGAQEGFDLDTARTFRLSMNDDAQLRLLPALMARLAPGAKGGPAGAARHGRAAAAAAGQRRPGPGPRLPLLRRPRPALPADHRGAPRGHRSPGHPVHRRAGQAGLTRRRSTSILPRAGRGSPLEIVLGSAKVRRNVLQPPCTTR